MKVERIAKLSDLINCGDYVDENEDVLLCVDLSIVNKHGDNNKSEFESFWNAMVHVVDMDGTGDQICQHTKSGNLETTTNFSYAPSTNSIYQLIKTTAELV